MDNNSINLVTTASGQQHFVFKFDYDKHLIKLITYLPGAKWHPQKRVWTCLVDSRYFGNIRQIERSYLDATYEVKEMIK